MSANSKIGWTMETWNFAIGCRKKSAGCKNCYAIREAWIHQHHPNPKIAKRYEATVEKLANGDVNWTGRVNIDYEILLRPLLKKKPTTFFVDSMSDMWYEEIDFKVIDLAFAVMALCPQHTFQILTKREQRALTYFTTRPTKMMVENAGSKVLDMHPPAGRKHREGHVSTKSACMMQNIVNKWPLPNVFIGVSVEDQKQMELRVPPLLKIPAVVKFLSCEPLLGPVQIPIDCNDGSGFVDWVICGGESGPLLKARPMHPQWARELRDQCLSSRTPFFFKQWGNWQPIDQPHDRESVRSLLANEQWLNYDGGSGFHGKEVYRMRHVTKTEAGHLLDRVQYYQLPNHYENVSQ